MTVQFLCTPSIQGYLYFVIVDGEQFDIPHKVLAEFYYDEPTFIFNTMVELRKMFPNTNIENITKENGFDRPSGNIRG